MTIETLNKEFHSLSSGLNELDTGFFVLDKQGNIIHFNNTASRILAISDSQHWETLHISHIDSVLSTGLAENFENIINHNQIFSKKNIFCTNRLGEYMTINLSCQLSQTTDQNQQLVIGLIEDINQKSKSCLDSLSNYQGLQLLSDVAEALSSVNELESILNVILTSATASQGLGFNRAFLFMYDNSDKVLKGHLAVGPASAEEAGYIWRELDSKRLSLPELFENENQKQNGSDKPLSNLIKDITINLNEESIISNACHNSQWVNLAEIESLDETTKNFAETIRTDKIALVPMVSKGRLTGLLAADNYITMEPISDNAIQLLQILANQGAVAMERAALYQEQKERNIQLEKMNTLIAESQEHLIKIEKMSVIGELTSSIAHELRNPLTIVGGFAGLMLKLNVTDEQLEYLNIITNEIKRAEAVLDQVLDFSKASKSDSKEIDFNILIENTMKLAISRQNYPDYKFPLSLEPIPLNIYGNYDQLSHAFYQFLRLIFDELIPSVRPEARVARNDTNAVLYIKLIPEIDNRDYLLKSLKQIFTTSKASQRLSILVAGEAIKFHGGNYGLSFDKEQNPTIYIEVPMVKEDRIE